MSTESPYKDIHDKAPKRRRHYERVAKGLDPLYIHNSKKSS